MEKLRISKYIQAAKSEEKGKAKDIIGLLIGVESHRTGSGSSAADLR